MRHKICFIILLLATACKLETEEILSASWKYADGFHVGDVLRAGNLDIHTDTIFVQGEKKAILLEASKRFDVLSELHIESLEHKEKGRYVSF